MESIPAVLSFVLRILDLQLARYIIVGALSTTIHILMAFSFVYLVNDSILYSNAFGFVNAYVFAYYAQSRFVFGHAASLTKAMKFLIVQVASLLIAVFLASLATQINTYLQILLVALILPFITFITHKLWTFSGHDS